MKVPTHIGKKFKTWDIFGWFMSFLGLGLMYHYIRAEDINIWQKIILNLTIFFFTIDYMIRVCVGRIYRIVYHDTILHNMYEVSAGENIYYVCAASEEELALYMEGMYPDIQYRILDTKIVESFEKTEQYK